MNAIQWLRAILEDDDSRWLVKRPRQPGRKVRRAHRRRRPKPRMVGIYFNGR